jgi:1,4-dihydroxy-6-naphthoate synthase
MFFGFATGQTTIPGCSIEHVLEDIETLNQRAAGADPLEVTAMSVHAFLHLGHRYSLLEVGSSVGRGYGPKVVATKPMSVSSLANKRIALPGPKTTTTLAARLLLPSFSEVFLPFTEIIDAVKDGEVDAGVLIHEGQLTYSDHGLALVCDLGQLFAESFGGLPLPLGVNCVRRDLPKVTQEQIATAYRHSVETALAQRADAVKYSLTYGRGAPAELLDRFVGMYVNADSLSLQAEVREAVEVLSTYLNRGEAQVRV